jgi:muramoyltetrapeptide carboxypeptidase LdcA involved in peptidoglycan recycling
MIPDKLKPGDEIRVVAPSRSMGIISETTRAIAIKRFEEMGLKVTYAKNVDEKDEFASSSIGSRVEDLHEAFADVNVKGILTAIGGFNVNQILKYLDYDLIKNNPKVLCGFSDITALSNAIYAKTGLVTYSGPHFSSFGMLKGLEYTVEYFKKCLMEEESFIVKHSKEWSNDPWFLDQEKREFITNEGYISINDGEAEGTIIGGNLCTFNLLQGTEYMPSLQDSILFIEDDDGFGDNFDVEFDRNLQSLIHLPDFSGVKGITVGRSEKRVAIPIDRLRKIIKTKKELDHLPVAYGFDFGHTTPIFTFPIGGKARLLIHGDDISLEIIEH